MLNYQQNIKLFNFKTYLLVFLYFTLLLSFYLGENSTGGAIVDFHTHSEIIDNFKNNFKETFYNYDKSSTRHSPVLFIILSLLKKIQLDIDQIRLIYLHINLLLPYLFYKCLKIKFREIDNQVHVLLVSLIFLSPTFRTLSIWPDTRLLGITLFITSLYYYLKFLEEKKFEFILKNIFFCAFSSYISPNFSLFSLFYFISYVNHYKFLSKEILKIVFFNIILAFPAFYYVFILDINFLSKSASVLRKSDEIFFVNIFNDFLITVSLIFFYSIPFIFTKVIKINKLLKLKNIIISSILFLISSYYFDYDIKNTGGGIFLKLSFFLFDNYIFFFLISIFSLLIFTNLILFDKSNILLFILILLNNPQYTLYHKYFDPLLMIFFFLMFRFQINLNKFSDKKNVIFVFFYFVSFLIISNLKYLWT